MTFEEFQKLALSPPYAVEESVYRIDVLCFDEPLEKRVDKKIYQVVLTESYLYSSLEEAKNKVKSVVESANNNYK